MNTTRSHHACFVDEVTSSGNVIGGIDDRWNILTHSMPGDACNALYVSIYVNKILLSSSSAASSNAKIYEYM